jgi:hypothetical protein
LRRVNSFPRHPRENGAAIAAKPVMDMKRITRTAFCVTLAVLGISAVLTPPLRADDPVTLQLSVKDRRFEPAEITAPANTRIILKVKNLDPTPMEFESASLRVEKVVAANSEGSFNLRPLQPGRYPFMDDFHQQTTGVLVVK